MNSLYKFINKGYRWENRTTEWVRFIGVGLRAEPTTVEVDGHTTKKVLEECFDV